MTVYTLAPETMKVLGSRAYLFVVFSVLTTLPVLWLGLSQVERWRSLVGYRADQAAEAAARTVTWEAELLLQSHMRDLERVAAQLEALGTLDAVALEQRLRVHTSRAAHYSGMYVGDATGRSVAAVFRDARNASVGIDYSDRDYYEKLRATGRTAVSRLQVGRRSGVPNIQIASPINNEDGSLRGFVEASLDLDSVQGIATRHQTLASGYRIVIVDHRSRVIADTADDSEGAFADLSSLELFTPADGKTPLRAGVNERGVEQRGAAVGILNDDVGWTVLAFRPQAAIESLARDASNRTWLVTLIALLGALGMSALVAHGMGRRISDLAGTVRAVGEGDFARRAAPKSAWEPAEVGVLIDAVGSMAERLQHHRADLEELVQRRTTQLAALNERLSVLVNALEKAGDGIEVTTPDAVYQYVNPAFEEITGYTSEELVGKTPAILRSGDYDEDFYRSIVETVAAGRVYRGVFTGKRKNGEAFDQDLTLWPVKDENGQIRHYVGVRKDVTENRKREHALRVSEQMASVGTLAAGVAHEINNPLAYLLLSLRFVERMLNRYRGQLPDEFWNKALPAIENALEGSERVESIVKDLRTFSRSDDESQYGVELRDVVESSIRMVKNDIRHRAKLITEFGPTPLVTSNASRLGQVFLNLLVNAIHALDAGKAKTNRIRVSTGTDENGNAVVEVEDTGCGIDEPDRLRIFDPFFTTKPVGVGTGLGLSLCHGIVSGAGGEITVRSRVGSGTTFRVMLPAAEPESGQRVVSVSAPALRPDANISVLIIDDDVAVARALGESLERYETVVVNSGEAGLQALRERRFDVVLCDVMMPGMTGMDVYRRLAQERPGLERRVIFITGGAFTPVAQTFLESVPNPCLGKPFTLRQVEAAMSQITGSGVGPVSARVG